MEIKQPYTITAPTNKMPPITKSINEGLKRLCPRKWLMLFSLKLQRDNRKNALAVDPAKAKNRKNYIFHYTMEIKQPQTITEPKTCILGRVVILHVTT